MHHDVKSETLFTIFDYVRNEVAAACVDIDKKIAANRKIGEAYESLIALASKQ